MHPLGVVGEIPAARQPEAEHASAFALADPLDAAPKSRNERRMGRDPLGTSRTGLGRRTPNPYRPA